MNDPLAHPLSCVPTENLAPYNLAQCSCCGRILLRKHLKGGACRDGTDCVLAQQLAWMARSGYQPSARELRWLEAEEEEE